VLVNVTPSYISNSDIAQLRTCVESNQRAPAHHLSTSKRFQCSPELCFASICDVVMTN
jgi:hypothetical protein